MRGEWVDPALGRTTLEECVRRYQAGRHNIRPSTAVRDESYFRNLVVPRLGTRTLASFDPQVIREWVAGLVADGYTPATIRKAYQLLAAALNLAVDDGLIVRSPCRGVSLPKIEASEKRFLDHDETELLASTIHPRYRAFVLTGAIYRAAPRRAVRPPGRSAGSSSTNAAGD